MGYNLVGVSSKHQLVNLYYYALGLDVVLKRHKVCTGSGRMFLRPVRGCCSCYLHWKVHSRGTNGRERDRFQVSDGKVERVLRAWMLLSYV